MAGLTLRRLPRRGERRVDIAALLWRMRWFGAAVAAAALVFYCILWFAFARVSAGAGAYLEQALGAPVRVERVRVSRGFRVDLSGVTVYEPGEKRGPEMLSARRVSLWPEWTSLLTGRMKARRAAVWSPRLFVRRAPGGGANVDPWIRRAARPRNKGAARAFPALFEIHDGSLLVQLDAGPRGAFLLIEGVNGRAGRAPRGRVALDFNAAVFGSDFTLRGLVNPGGSTDMFALDAHAPFFAFSELADLLRRTSPAAFREAPEMTFGTGRLDAHISGAPGALRITGRASLRDLDAEFSVEDRALHLWNLNAGVGAQKVSGTASLDFGDPALPFLLQLEIKGLDLAALLNPATGFQYAPQGQAQGELRVSGALNSQAAPAVSGSLHVRDGALRFPLLYAGPGPSPFGNTASLAFDSLSTDFASASDTIRLENLRVTGPGYTLSGRADLGAAPASLAGFEAPFTYSADLDVSAPDLELAFSSVPAWQGLASGSLKGRLTLRGDLGSEGSAAGTARFTISRGALHNPYLVPGGLWGGVSADHAFNRLTCTVRLGTRTFHFSGAMSGGGLEADWDGRADMQNGGLHITGKVKADASAAARFQGLAPYVSPDPPGASTTYSASVRITGALDAPVTAWSRPRAVRIIHAPHNSIPSDMD